MAGIIGMPGRLQSVQAAGFARNPRPTSSECAIARDGGTIGLETRTLDQLGERLEQLETTGGTSYGSTKYDQSTHVAH